MRKLESPAKDWAYFFYRLLAPLFDPIKFVRGLYGYCWFAKDLVAFRKNGGKINILSTDLYPILDERTDFTPFDAQYFYQQLWVFREVLKAKPPRHVDVGSSYEMSGYLSSITLTTFVDLRPIKAELPNLKVVRGDVTNLPFETESLPSLSCLHVIEHIGLGRYGDKIDPAGHLRACKELARVLLSGGKLYLSAPVGKERVCFNAHRVFTPESILGYFPNLQLAEFSLVDDEGTFHRNVRWQDFSDVYYGCGMFLFVKN